MQLINNQRYAQLAGVDYSTEQIKPGPIVYSRTHTVVDQFIELATYGDCVLVTSFSDACVTQNMADQLPSNVRHWYSNNVGCVHPRVSAIPIGCVYNVEREEILLERLAKGPGVRNKLMYINFTRAVPRTPNPRVGLYEMFLRHKWTTVKGGVTFASVPAKEFYTDLREHKYCLSPHGAGPDCHRHWEAMILGCIPVVLRCRENDILEDLPCIRVNQWDHLTEDLLLRTYDELLPRFNDVRPLYFDYWKDKICTT